VEYPLRRSFLSVIFFVLGSTVAMSPKALASQGLRCEAVFADSSTVIQTRYWFRANQEFDLNRFIEIRDDFSRRLNAEPSNQRQAISELSQTKDPVARLALIEAVARRQGLGFFDFKTWFQMVDHSQRKQLYSALRRLEFGTNTRWTSAQKTLVKLYLLANPSPSQDGVIRVLRRSWSEHELLLIRHRVEQALVSQNLTHALVDLGLIRAPDARDHAAKMLKEFGRPLRMALSLGLSAASFYIPFASFKAPAILDSAPDVAREQLIDAYLGNRVSIQTLIHMQYGPAARNQQFMDRATRVVLAALVPVVAYVLLDDLYRYLFNTKEAMAEKKAEVDQLKQEFGSPLLGDQSSIYDDTGPKESFLTEKQRNLLVNQIIERDIRLTILGTDIGEMSPAEQQDFKNFLRNDPEFVKKRQKLNSVGDHKLVEIYKSNPLQ